MYRYQVPFVATTSLACAVLVAALPARSSPATDPAPLTGRIERGRAAIRLALYFRGEAPPEADVKALVADTLSGLDVTVARQSARNAPLRDEDLSGDFADALRLTRECKQVLRLDIAAPPARSWQALRGSTRLADELLARSGAVILDGNTRQLYTPGEWRERRTDTLSSDRPEIWPHVLSYGHSPPPPATQSVVTLGMSKLGFPELIVPDVAPALLDAMTLLVQFTGQALVDADGRVGRGGALEVDLRKYPQAFDRPIRGRAITVRFARMRPGVLRVLVGDHRVALETLFGMRLPI